MNSTENKDRINEFIEVIMQVARGDYSAQIKVSEKNNHLDALAMGINMMVDDIKKNHEVELENDRITELNAQLQITKDKAEESDRLKSAFLANMSHEIRTPMNGILGFTDLLKTPNLTPENQTKYIDIIQKSGNRLLNIINDLIDVSKVESGQVEASISKSNINNRLEYIYNFFKPEVEAKKMQLLVNYGLSKNESIIKTDREKFYAIITNLVKNAIKYSNSGTIEFGYEKKGEFLEFYVKDTGIGIAEKHHTSIFDRFIQTDTSLSSGYEGAGLGLAISKAYVEMLGGSIWVKSEQGKGSEFYFTIPYNYVKEEKITINNLEIEAPETDDELLNLKTLIVEDDEVSEFLITNAITTFSKEILTAENGLLAIDKCRKNPDINLILMDMRMPFMDGYEATREIRKFNKDVIIIAQTAFGMSGDREKTLAAGCNDYIAKPVNSVQLKNIVKNQLKKKNIINSQNKTITKIILKNSVII